MWLISDEKTSNFLWLIIYSWLRKEEKFTVKLYLKLKKKIR